MTTELARPVDAVGLSQELPIVSPRATSSSIVSRSLDDE